MKRSNFLKSIGIAGMGSIIPLNVFKAKQSEREGFLPPNCVLIPTETAGPFPLDLTENSKFFRKNLIENKTGVPLHLKLKVIGSENCLPMNNVRVNIWHCDKDGLYSGYSQQNNQGQAGQTYLRGYQFADANGEVQFETIFPGWYNGRICHIHFQVYVSSVYAAISQLTFPLDIKNKIYTDNSSLYTKGADPMSLNSDMIFADGYAYQLASLTPNLKDGGYDAYLEVTIQGNGMTGLANLEPENYGQFSLKQNYPNPYIAETVIPFILEYQSDVQLELYNLEGQKLYSIRKDQLAIGHQEIKLNLNALRLPLENYVYQLEVKNRNGIFRSCKMMTAAN